MKNQKLIILSSLGGGLEYFDFYVYVLFSPILSQLFFPKTNHLLALLATYAIMSISFFVRPFGAGLLGHFADIYGRKKVFLFSVTVMAVTTGLVGFLPTYASIGIWAPILLIFLRMLQGLSLGSEVPGALVFIAEHIDVDKRALYCGIVFACMMFGAVIGAVMGIAIKSEFSRAAQLAWVWRAVFIFAGCMGMLSYFFRRHLEETPVFQAMQSANIEHIVPVIAILKQHFVSLLAAIAMVAPAAASFIVYFYLPVYLENNLQYSLQAVAWIAALNLALIATLFVIFGWIADRVNKKYLLIAGALIYALTAVTTFWSLNAHNIAMIAISLVVFAAAMAATTGAYTVLLIGLFPVNQRYTGVSLAYSIANTVFAGASPFIATYLIHLTESNMAPIWFLVFSAVVCLFSGFRLRPITQRHGVKVYERYD